MNAFFLPYLCFFLLVDVIHSAPFPESPRSRKIIHKVSPLLSSELQKKDLQLGNEVFIRIFKKNKQLELWMRPPHSLSMVRFKTYPIAGMSGRLGPKLAEGDFQAPEGFYSITPKSFNPNSSYHLSFNIGYPNQYDKTHRRTGSFIMVHGGHASIGCFAMTNPGIEEIYTLCQAALKSSQKKVMIHIFPFALEEKKLRAYARHPSFLFWKELQAGYLAFEKTHTPPHILVQKKRYVLLP